MKKIKKTSKGYVLAEGETTGHSHIVKSDIELYDLGNETKEIRTNIPVEVFHEEHKTVISPSPKKKSINVEKVIEFNHLEKTIERLKD